MDVEVYMEQPEPFNDGSGRVCLLKKSLYGLKQSPLIWNATLKAFLLELGFKVSVIAEGIYVKWINGVPIFLAVYVDDVVITAKPDHAKWLIKELSVEFKLKDLGVVSNLLAMNVDMQTDALKFSQELYVRNLLKHGRCSCAHESQTRVSGKALGSDCESRRSPISPIGGLPELPGALYETGYCKCCHDSCQVHELLHGIAL